MSKPKINREYKDRLFKFVFGNEQNKQHLLTLYNALHHTNYANVDDLTITTLDDFIYMKMKNDVSFLISSYMVLFEHQSTFNPNMPFREFEYCANLYSKIVEKNHYKLYSHTMIKLPSPQCYVFYNGEDRDSDREVLRLSDAFEVPVEGYEWTTIMLNINKGHNRELMLKCKMLQDYSNFVAMVKEHMKTDTLENAIAYAVSEAIAQGGDFADFILAHKSEVTTMCFTEFDEKQWEAEVRREAMAEGEKRGEKSAINIFIEDKLDDHIPDEIILTRLGTKYHLSNDDAQKMLSEVKSTYKPLS